MKKFFLILVFGGFFTKNLFAQKYFTGLIFDDESYSKSTSLVEQSRLTFSALPSSASLRKYCPKPGNQIQLNTSVAWAGAWGARTILEAKKNNWTNTDSITYKAFSPIFSYQLVRGEEDEKCQKGSKMDELLRQMKVTGSVKYLDFLEFCPQNIPHELTVKAKNNSLSDFIRLFEVNSNSDYKINSVKKALSENYPVVVGMYCPPSFQKAKDLWQPLELVDKDFPGHAVCVVGYDNTKYGGAFEIMNSWGRGWGNGGFTWIRYDDFADFVRYGFELIMAASTPSKNNQLKASVEVLTDDNREIPVRHEEKGKYILQKIFKEGDNFRIRIQHASQCYFYVLGSGSGNDFTQLFPHQETISPSLVFQSNNLSIPDDQHFIQVTGNEKHDFLYLIFSKYALDIDYVLSEMQVMKGKGLDIFYEILGNKIVSPHDVTWDNLTMSYDAAFEKGEIVPLIIQFDHQ